MAQNFIQNAGAVADGFFELPLAKQLLLFLGLAFSVAIGTYVIIWSKSPDYVPLYSQLNNRDSGDVVDGLQRSGISFKVDENSGLVLVDAAKVQEARIKLASMGLPSHSGNGFEILDKENVFGASQLVERARYIRALEGELEKTISSIENVKSARIHLAIPKQSSFIREQRDPSASVLVDIGRMKLEQDQIAAISNLVASSVQGLSPQHVTIIDQNGKLLNSASDDTLGYAAKQLEYTRKLEKMYAQRIHDLLAPVVGYDSVKAEVTAVLDFTSTEETSENYDPKNPVIRSEKFSGVERMMGEPSGGVPGMSSNTASEKDEAQAKEKVSSAKPRAASGGILIDNQEVRNYEIDRKVKHQVFVPGKLIKLSAAVVLDDKTTYDEKGKVTKTPLSKEEMEKMEGLVKDAIGFDDTRGDRVKLINSTFAKGEIIGPVPPEAFYKQSWFTTVVKILIGASAILVLVMMVLRPMMTNLTNISLFKRKIMDQITQQSSPNTGTIEDLSEAQFQTKIKEVIDENPMIAAQIIRQWVGKENEKGR